MQLQLVKNHNSFKCEECCDTVYKTFLKEDGSFSISLCQNCLSKNPWTEREVYTESTRCKSVSEKGLNFEDKKAFFEHIKRLKTIGYTEDMLRALTMFFDKYPEVKRKQKHAEILKNPQDFRIVRPVEQHQFTALHLFTRNQVFQIISKENRGKKTRIDEFGELIDISEDRTFIGWGSNLHFTISGPCLCDYDQSVFDSLIKLWHENESIGITLTTNLTQIWKKIGNQGNMSEKNKISLKRSLSRLHKVSIEAKSTDKKNTNFWGGGLIDSVLYIDGKNYKNNKIVINFNSYMVNGYLQGSYSTISHPVYQKLSSYARKIYLFLISHSDRERKIDLNKLKKVIGVNEDISEKHFKEQILEALKELKKAFVLEENSKIERNILITIITELAWDNKPNFT